MISGKNCLVGRIETLFASTNDQRYAAGYLLPMLNNGLMFVAVKQQGPARDFLEMFCSTHNDHFIQTGEFLFGHMSVGQKEQLIELMTKDGFGHLAGRVHKTAVTTVGMTGPENVRLTNQQLVLQPGELRDRCFHKLSSPQINMATLLEWHYIEKEDITP